MAQRIGFISDKTQGTSETKGSDGRLNVSSRSDSRAYYNSRDESEAFSLVWKDASTETGDYILYWQNTDVTGRELVIEAIGINSAAAGDFEVHIVTGTAAGGSAATPVCLNRAAPKAAQSNALTAAAAPVTGLTLDQLIDTATCSARGHEEFRLNERLRIGQNQAVAIFCDLADTSPMTSRGVVYGYYE